jgi:hypothetical protein
MYSVSPSAAKNSPVEISSKAMPNLFSVSEVEQKLARELHWWDDDIVNIGGVKYKKVYLQDFYKKI